MDSTPSILFKKIKAKSGSGRVFSPTDFLDIANRATIDQALSRLAKAGKIRRLARGLYDIPRYNSLLRGFAPPDHQQVIQAIARRDGVKIIPDNLVHANGLGLTNAVPAKSVYLTDGPSRVVSAGGWALRMKHVSPGFLKNATSKSGPVFQALLWLGKDIAKSSPTLPMKIRSKISDDVAVDLAKRVNSFPSWMKPLLSDVSSMGTSNARRV